MCRPRPRGRWIWLALLGAPGSVWVLVVLLTPTGWVKARLAARLEAETGRAVAIGSVHLGWLGGLKIVDLSLAERSNPADPWLRVGETAIDVAPVRVLLGCCRPGAISIDRAEVRIWRRSDGQFEFGDLAQGCPSSQPRGGGKGSASDPAIAIDLRVTNSRLRLVDDHDDLRVTVDGITATGSAHGSTLEVGDLHGAVNGGTVRLAARLARDPAAPLFCAEIQATRVHLGPSLSLIETFVPLVARSEGPISGRLNLQMDVRGQGVTNAEIRRSLTGHGSFLLDPIDLDGSRILTELKVLGEWPDEGHVGAVSSNFSVGGGRITTDDLTIRAARLPFVVGGWTDFDGQFDYSSRVDRMIATLPREARSLLADLQGNLEELTDLRIAGTKDKATLSLNGCPLATSPGGTNKERVRFRETARKIRDRFFR